MVPSVTAGNGSPHGGDSEHTVHGLCWLAGEHGPPPSAFWILPVMCECCHSEETLAVFLLVCLCAYTGEYERA